MEIGTANQFWFSRGENFNNNVEKVLEETQNLARHEAFLSISFMGKTVLTRRQRIILQFLSQDIFFREHFYFGGGTALAECYLHHRLSEDLDFFSVEEFDVNMLEILMKKLRKNFKIYNVEYKSQFHRNLFFLEFSDKEILKMEFTYFPFERIDASRKFLDLSIDSLIDIAVNKLHTIAQQPRSRDFIDLFFILQQEALWSIDELLRYIRIKFDTVIDFAQLGKQFLLVSELKDYPKMLIKLPSKKWQKFFLDQAQGMKEKLLM